jgi:hypothetical protein
MGYTVNPGTNETNFPVPLFNLTPAATVDEGNNWINMRFGPLSLTHPVNGNVLGNYSPAAGSSVIQNGTSIAQSNVAPPTTDFFGNPRTTPYDIGAVESGATINRSASLAPSSLTFSPLLVGSNSATQNVTVTNTGNVGLTGGTFTFAGPFNRITTGGFPAGAPNCTAALALGASCTIKVRYSSTAVGTQNGSLTVAYTLATVTPASVTLTGTGIPSAATFSLGAHTSGVTFTAGSNGGALSFGTQPNPSTASATLVVTNTGATSFNFTTGNTVTGLRFAKGTDTCTGSLAAGANCSITVTFSPNSTATRNGTLTVRDNTAGNPQVVTLTGN